MVCLRSASACPCVRPVCIAAPASNSQMIAAVQCTALTAEGVAEAGAGQSAACARSHQAIDPLERVSSVSAVSNKRKTQQKTKTAPLIFNKTS